MKRTHTLFMKEALDLMTVMSCITRKPLWILLFFSLAFIPTCIAVGCEEPPSVQNADYDLETLGEPFLNGTLVFYSCHNGYVLNGSLNASAVCIVTHDGHHWQNHSPFTCEPICEGLPHIPHGELKLDGKEPPFFTGDYVSYACEFGYTAEVASPKVVCMNKVWILPQEPCRARSCGYPGDIENSRRIGDLFNFPNNVTFVCNEGYLLKGSASIFCSTTGAWRPSQLPSCEAVFCPLLSHPEHGKVISSDRKYKAVATYECNRNFHREGSEHRICQSDATWNGSVPTCVETICLNPGPLPHGRVLPTKNVYKSGDVVVFTCFNSGKTRASKCLEEGTWNQRPPLCEGPLETTESPAPVKSSSHSTVVQIVEPTSETVFPVKSSSCDDPGDIRNGKKWITGFASGSNVTYSCEEGYEIRGKSTLVCLPTGKWDFEKLPICVKPIPTTTIVGVVIGIILLIVLGVAGYYFYRWRERKVRGYGKKSKALTADATDIEEIAGLGKEKKPIPVTVL